MAGSSGATVTVVFADVEGSTALLERLGQARWLTWLAEYEELLGASIEQHGGSLDVGEDDGDRGAGGSRHPPILTDQGTGDEGLTGRRATPLRVPASATAAATASATSRLNTLGIT